ncbi:MAG: carboxymuconolactone decarboxylase family protein [Alphaproteobacteria bacterium]|jgi:alkyl hydroperoxide reductase subunit D|nr:carboxymuconolactone decarboxylase family protein [Alphaproteobacteria bacterium]MCB1550837.1 carboxymuconolactone decarboxylase family protein [Alphaproteobacteria bacterium]MCB9984258.1 carboxymuconolactone decarboxylase family protein [Micavibrio sp.]HPQ51078.1 carboxymuconolactone decarboxylase family protein [Alphaproteobacteria bacterium]HRK97102.1 carboxymuconolactone decarboxylase family protein [Alphaproteobacteria bacterium]
MTSFEDLRNALPEYAKDIKLNLSNLMAEESLNSQQLWGCFLACAMATRQGDVIAAIDNEASKHLSAEARNAACGAAAIMAMNNVYYRSVHLMSNKEYQNLPAKLRMTFIASHGVDKIDFELWSMAVSAINGCGMCLDAHEAQVVKAGLSMEQIQCALRIAATINAAAAAIESAKYLSADIAQAA